MNHKQIEDYLRRKGFVAQDETDTGSTWHHHYSRLHASVTGSGVTLTTRATTLDVSTGHVYEGQSLASYVLIEPTIEAVDRFLYGSIGLVVLGEALADQEQKDGHMSIRRRPSLGCCA